MDQSFFLDVGNFTLLKNKLVELSFKNGQHTFNTV